jgi:hypothetical protein
LTLHSSSHGGDRHHDEATLTVTASNTTADEAATSAAQALKIKDSAREVHDHHHAALFDQYVAAGFHNDHDGAGQMTSFPEKQQHQACGASAAASIFSGRQENAGRRS